MSGFKDFDELVTRAPKRLPIGGVMYEFPDRVSARTGTLLLAMSASAKDLGPDPTPTELFETIGLDADQINAMQAEMLGDGHRALVAAGLGHAVGHVIQTLTVWHLYGQEAAERVWNSLGPTPAPSRAARRSKATATSTPSPASRTGTTSARKPTKAAARRGGSSSRSGRS